MTVRLEDLLKQTNVLHPDQLIDQKVLRKSQVEIESFSSLYNDAQGNILKSHGRKLSVHLFLEFKVEQENICEAKKWISDFAQNFVNSASNQRKSTLLYRERMRLKQDEPASENLFANFFLSFDGYKILLGNHEQLEKCFKDSTFKNGMKNGISALNDPPVCSWEKGFTKKIHALILLAGNDADCLSIYAEKVENEVKKFATIVHNEFGKVFRNNNHEPIEHFGFVDGISQPLFFEDDTKKDATDKWDPSAPPNLVLVKDPLNPKNYSCGSFLVYRKLQQHVACFKEKIRELATKLDIKEELAEAFVVGRFKDGTPVTLYNRALFPNMIPNNFDYQGDIHGTRCPFQAHIRKTNPRGEKTTDPDENQRDKRIARRGISYSYQKHKVCTWKEQLKYLDQVLIDETTNNDVGLLFMCFQSSITNQFVTQQKTWANEMHFPKNDTGIDPIIGQGKQLDGGQYWPKNKDGWDENHKGRFDFSKCVQMKGGEYFFAPSISFLIDLPGFTLQNHQCSQTGITQT